MKKGFFLGLSLVAGLAFAGTVLGQDEQSQPPTNRMTFSIRGGGAQDPAQAEAARAGARQAEAEAAKVEAQTQGERAREQAERLNRDALMQGDAPLRNFGVLGGPLSPTVPSGMRR